jgi:anthranilate synthase/aminodeoxychorismate synthase-like glutamine amidotransferase
MENVKILFIDNFDSFTYNLVDEFCKRSCIAKVYRSDIAEEKLKEISQQFDPDMVVISPGPGNPDSAGVSLWVVDYFKDKLPILGVCLGHQVIVQYFGGTIGRSSVPVHGKGSRINHNGTGIFQAIENPMQVGRYHSLCAEQLPGCLEQNAEYEGIVMGVKHRDFDIFGVQFHPESILTPGGGKIIENMINIAMKNRIRRLKV